MSISPVPGYSEFNPKPVSAPISEEDLGILKELYALILNNGKICPVEFDDWSVYGNSFELGTSVVYSNPEFSRKDRYDPYYVQEYAKSLKDRLKNFREEIKTLGVNWEATTIPELRTYSEFVGTGNDNESRNYWVGILELNNGTRAKVYAEDNFVYGAHAKVETLLGLKENNSIKELVAKTFGTS